MQKTKITQLLLMYHRAYLDAMKSEDYAFAVAMAEKVAEVSLKGVLERYSLVTSYVKTLHSCAALLGFCQKAGIDTKLDLHTMHMLDNAWRQTFEMTRSGLQEYSFDEGLQAGVAAEEAMLLLQKHWPSAEIADLVGLDEEILPVRLRPEVRLYQDITGNSPFELYIREAL